MLRLFRTLVVLTIALGLGDLTARADELDSLINLELAFRDTILDQPAPGRYQSLIRDGETTITFVSDLQGGLGRTDFFLNANWSYDYRYTTEPARGKTNVAVTPLNVKLTTRMRHVIRMPVSFHREDVWESRLLGHEFDHVAVSLDPRVPALLQHLCGDLPVYRFAMDGLGKPGEQQMREGINDQIQRRESAVLDLVRANYVALDKVSQNGGKAIQDRQTFFGTLYTQSNLEAAEFPFHKEVASLLESESYRQLRPRHVPDDPKSLPRR